MIEFKNVKAGPNPDF